MAIPILLVLLEVIGGWSLNKMGPCFLFFLKRRGDVLILLNLNPGLHKKERGMAMSILLMIP